MQLQQDQPTGIDFHQWLLPDGSIWASFYRLHNGYLIRFPKLGDFTISADGLDISVNPEPGVASQTIEHLYLNQILPLAMSRQLKLVLHGGAIELDDHAIAMVGLSGRGKSTLTTSFSTSGYRFLTDDGLHIEALEGRYFAQPSHPSIRLWEDSRAALIATSVQAAPPLDFTSKARLLAGDQVQFCAESRPLCALYFLGEGSAESVTIDSVGGRDAIIELVRHSFLLDMNAREMLSYHFGQLTDLVKTVPCFHLDYPRHYEYLPQVRSALVTHARSLSREAGQK